MEVTDEHHALVTIPSGKAHGINGVGGWVGPRVDLDAAEKKKFRVPICNRFKLFGRSTRSLVAIWI
jgi:hypothetical protein